MTVLTKPNLRRSCFKISGRTFEKKNIYAHSAPKAGIQQRFSHIKYFCHCVLNFSFAGHYDIYFGAKMIKQHLSKMPVGLRFASEL